MKNQKILYIFSVLFVVLLIVFFITEEYFVQKSQQYFINTIKQEIKILINTKEQKTFEIAKNLSVDKNLINIIKNNDYKYLYKYYRFPIYDNYTQEKTIGVNIIDSKGFIRYRSWSKKGLNKNILKYRPDLVKFLKNPHPKIDVIVGIYDISFKATIPVFDKKKLIAILEVTHFFYSIIDKLKTQHIYSTIILAKETSKNIKFNNYGEKIGDYFVSNKIDKKIKSYLNKNLETYIKIKPDEVSYVVRDGDFFDGYYVINIPIKNSHNQLLGYFVAFIEDTYELKEKEIFLNIIMIIISILFIIMWYMAYKNSKENERLIRTLNDEVKKQISEKLELIYTDNLTKAYKKTKFEIDKSKYADYYVVMLNIRNFSKINELYGFKTGDDILRIVVKRVENLLDLKIYRIHADEFIFFSKNYKKTIKNIKHLFINDPIKLSEDNVNLRLSFSFAVTKNEGNEILRQLSIALKEAKLKPFREFIYYKPREIKKDFIKFNSLLYDAIFSHEHSKIIPYFQGIRDNLTGEIIKYESLARLKVDDKIYSPFFFIDIAKSSGFLFEITKIMIDKSFAKIANTNINLSINITEDDLLTFKLKNYLIEKLEKYNLKAEQITLEILEGITSSGTKGNIEQLKELKEMGFKIAIDDFGVEYSNFERIQELDIDFIKIDGKYIKNINIDKKSYEIAKAITHFAHSLGIKVIAEFVENEEIQKIIEELAIEYSQGYYFSKPKEEI